MKVSWLSGLLIGGSAAVSSNNVDDKVWKSSIVFSGTCEKASPRTGKCAEIMLWHVFKGDELLDDSMVQNKIVDGFEQRQLSNLDSVNSDVRENETRIFFAAIDSGKVKLTSKGTREENVYLERLKRVTQVADFQKKNPGLSVTEALAAGLVLPGGTTLDLMVDESAKKTSDPVTEPPAVEEDVIEPEIVSESTSDADSSETDDEEEVVIPDVEPVEQESTTVETVEPELSTAADVETSSSTTTTSSASTTTTSATTTTTTTPVETTTSTTTSASTTTTTPTTTTSTTTTSKTTTTTSTTPTTTSATTTPEPEVSDPEAVEPEVSEPEVSETEVSDSEVSEPEVSEPEVSEPDVSEPYVSEPEIYYKDEDDNGDDIYTIDYTDNLNEGAYPGGEDVTNERDYDSSFAGKSGENVYDDAVYVEEASGDNDDDDYDINEERLARSARHKFSRLSDDQWFDEIYENEMDSVYR